MSQVIKDLIYSAIRAKGCNVEFRDQPNADSFEFQPLPSRTGVPTSISALEILDAGNDPSALIAQKLVEAGF